jgi:16S rRNA (adenine1518-N6/adenine1519-N6)-dimethyltransferase
VTASLLGPAQIRQLASELGLRPAKSLGQNFVIDAGTVRRIVRIADVADQHVLEIGPGFGSLTLALLEVASTVTAVEVDPRLAAQLPATVAEHAPSAASRLRVLQADALDLPDLGEPAPSALVANLPYNVAVPALLTALERLPGLNTALVMVQAEVADRIAASPGSRIYGVPSAKVAWYASARRVGSVSRSVFWPVPNVDSALVALTRRETPTAASREATFAVIDAAFAQRRKTLRAALAGLATSPQRAETALTAAGIEPRRRGEDLTITEFAAVAASLAELPS